MIEALSGNVSLYAADDMATDPSSEILALTEANDPGTGSTTNPNLPAETTGNIAIYGDWEPLLSVTPGIGTTIVLRGTVTPGVNGLTRVFGNINADTIIFDQTYLCGNTRAYGSARRRHSVSTRRRATAPARPARPAAMTRSPSTACSR